MVQEFKSETLRVFEDIIVEAVDKKSKLKEITRFSFYYAA